MQHSMKVPLMLRDIQNKTESQADRQLINTIIETEEASLRKSRGGRAAGSGIRWNDVMEGTRRHEPRTYLIKAIETYT